MDVQRKKKSIARIVGTDTPVAIRLRYIGPGAPTSVTITTGTGIVFISAEAIATTQSFTFANFATVGAVIDAINSGRCTEAAGGILWEAKILDALRSDASASTLTRAEGSNGAITATTFLEGHVAQTVYDVMEDTSTGLALTVRLSAARGFDKDQLKKHTQVTLKGIKYYVDLGTAAADSVQVYETDGTTEVKKLSYLSIDLTATEIDFASGFGGFSAEDGNDLVVRIKDAATLVNATTNFLQAVGEVTY